MSRKILAFLLLAALMLSVALTACQPAPEPVEEPAVEEPAAEEPAAEEPAAEEPAVEEPTEEPVVEEPTEEPEAEIMGIKLSELAGTTISFWHVWGEGAPSEGMTAIVDEFNATNEWDITVEAVDQGGYRDAEDAMNVAIQSGDVPNAIVGYTNAIAGWHAVGMIADLQPYFDDPDVGFTAEEIADFYAGPFDGGVLADGTRIALPISQSANVLFYNKTWAQELGFDSPPATSAELMEQACAATAANAADDDPDNDGTGGLVLYASASNVFSFLFAEGDDGLTDDGAGYDFTSQATQDVAVFLKTIWDEGCAFPTESYPNPEFATRKALFVMSSTAGLPYQIAAFETAGSVDDWGYIPFPGSAGNLAVNAFGQYITLVNTNPVQNLAAFLFLKFWTSPETQATWINASAYYPVRMSANDLLGDYSAANPLWGIGLDLMQYGSSEPNMASWGSVRRLVGDYFDMIIQGVPEDIPTHLEALNAEAAEVVAEID